MIRSFLVATAGALFGMMLLVLGLFFWIPVLSFVWTWWFP